MVFRKYNDIENATNKVLLEFKESDLYDPNDIWVALQKIDGANFALLFDENDKITCARRKSTLGDNASFFGFQKIFDKYPTSSFLTFRKEVLEWAKENHPDYSHDITIHGELFGGYYKGLKTEPNVSAIQKRAYYTNSVEFAIFDVRMFNENEKSYQFLPHDVLFDIGTKHSLFVIPIIFQGTLDECLVWAKEHNADPSEIWKLLGMSHEVEGNIREGNVIKPLKTIFKGQHRVIFKDKNEKFDERDKNRKARDKVKKEVHISDEVYKLLAEANEMICVNRFYSVTSKFGEYTIKDFQDLMNLLTDDVVDEIERDPNLNETYSNLSNMDKKILRDNILKLVSKFMGANKREIF